MSFSPAGAKNFKKGEVLLAVDLNNLAQRLERLEKVFSGNLMVYNGQNGVAFNLPHNIPEVEFIRLTEDVTADEEELFNGVVLTQTYEGEFEVTTDEVEFRNIFRCTFASGKNALIIRFPRGNGEWIIIPKACN